MDTGSAAEKISYARLEPADPAPWFTQRSSSNPRYTFDTAAGRYLVMCFFASAADPRGRAALNAVTAHRDRFDDKRFSFYGISIDAMDEAQNRVRESMPGIRFFYDFDGRISRLYGAIPKDTPSTMAKVQTQQFWVILDPTMRVMATFPLTEEPKAVIKYLDGLPAPDRFAGFEVFAPVLVLPSVFEPDCLPTAYRPL